MAKPAISDRALVRWLERSGAMKIEEMRELLAASLERAFSAALSLGSTRFLMLADGLVFIVEDGTVVTVVTDDGRHAARIKRPDRTAP